jgi:membrane-associated progesterone receptor component
MIICIIFLVVVMMLRVLALAAFVCSVLTSFGILTVLEHYRHSRSNRKLSKRQLSRANGCPSSRDHLHRSVFINPEEFDLDELSHYDGQRNETILVALDWRVYDVTGAKSLYGPNKTYGYLAGRDITRPVVCMTDRLDVDLTTGLQAWDDYLDLTPSERDTLNEWIAFFQGKYPEVGHLVRHRTPPDLRQPSGPGLLVSDDDQLDLQTALLRRPGRPKK